MSSKGGGVMNSQQGQSHQQGGGKMGPSTPYSHHPFSPQPSTPYNPNLQQNPHTPQSQQQVMQNQVVASSAINCDGTR